MKIESDKRNVKPNRRWSIALLALLLTIAACGGPSGSGTTDQPSDTQGGTTDTQGGAANTTASTVDDGMTVELPAGVTQAIYEAALEEGEVNLYAAQGESTEVAMAAAFNALYPDVVVNITRLGSAPLYEKITVEADAGQYIFDVVNFADEPIMRQAKEAGLLANRVELGLEPDTENFVDIAFDPDGMYLNFLINTAGMAYNQETMPEELIPTTWEDFINPELAGQIGAPENDGGGPGWAIQWFQRKLYGIEYWEQVHALDPVWYDSSAASVQAVENGEKLLAFAADSSIYPFLANGLVQLVVPDDVILPIPYNTAISANAPNPNAAILYSAWYTSQAGQTELVKLAGAWSTRTDVPPPTNRPAIADIEDRFYEDRSELFDPELVQAQYAEWREIMEIDQ